MVKIKQVNRNVHEVRHFYSKGWEQWYLLGADVHLDNPKCNRKAVEKDFEKAKKRKAKIMLFGDTNCIMQSKFDKRGSKGSVRPENNKDNYFDSVVDTTAEFLSRYPVVLLTEGNHETSVLKRHETDIVQRVVDKINYVHKPEIPVHKGGYSGYVVFRFESNRKAGGGIRTVKLWYHHGYGGGGEVTGGVIQMQRRAVYVSDADIIVSGHVHESVGRKFEKIKLSHTGKIQVFTQRHLILPTYKDEYEDGNGGYHIENGRPPKPIGGIWLRFFSEDGVNVNYEIVDTNDKL
jgi:UDP-2,3-diacylglucosamine pyrophosphatase LpxH